MQGWGGSCRGGWGGMVHVGVRWVMQGCGGSHGWGGSCRGEVGWVN